MATHTHRSMMIMLAEIALRDEERAEAAVNSHEREVLRATSALIRAEIDRVTREHRPLAGYVEGLRHALALIDPDNPGQIDRVQE